jgi:preprotein translocase subunit YajC
MNRDSLLASLFMYGAIALIFYFVLYRPQAAQRKQHDAMIKSLKRGDEVVTAGGIIGEVLSVKEQTTGTSGNEDRVTIRSGESRLVVERARIARVSRSAGAPGAGPAATPNA